MVIRFYSDRFFHPTDNTEDFQCTMIACTDLQNIRAQRLVNIHGIRSLDLQVLSLIVCASLSFVNPHFKSSPS